MTCSLCLGGHRYKDCPYSTARLLGMRPDGTPLSEPDGTPYISAAKAQRLVASVLADAVAEEVADLTADLDDFESKPELPAPPRDLTTYADALASARAKCEHKNFTNILYGREWQCDDCGKYLSKEDVRKSNPYGWLFG